MTNGNILREEVEAQARDFLRDNPLLLRARRGEVPPDAVGRYLASLRFVVGHNILLLDRARERARLAGLVALSTHFARKLGEEEGHDRWADHDLRVLRASFAVRDLRVAPAIEELVDLVAAVVDEEPALFLAYGFWAETLTTLAGGELVRALVEQCGIPAAALTCLARHVELDREHSDDGIRALDDLASDASLLPRMREVIGRAMALFDRMCEQVLEVPVEARP